MVPVHPVREEPRAGQLSRPAHVVRARAAARMKPSISASGVAGAMTGRPFTATLPARRYADPATVQVGVDIDRPTLDARIAARVEHMWELGFVEEVRALVGRGLREGLTANRALGYRQILMYLDGEITEAEAKEQTITGTRRFARRQDSWFRKDPRVTWTAYDDPERVEQALATVERVS